MGGVVQEKLVFIIGAPRSGSTLLNRMIGAHTRIHAPSEPHLLTPLAHLGYYERVDAAAYDPIISQLGVRELVDQLPGGEGDYLAALRAYSDALYAQLLAATPADRLVDKTPAYALVLDFVAKLYPEARYLVLTRHPMAVWSSVVDSFFDGDHELAHRHNPIIERYVPAIARFLRERPVPLQHIRYEELVAEPERHMRAACDFLGVDFEAGMVDYGEAAPQQASARGLGDPMTVASETRPTTESLARWAGQVQGRPQRLAQCHQILSNLDDRDLEVWGTSRREIQQELAGIDPAGSPARGAGWSRHVLERRLLMTARRRVGDNWLGRGVRALREFCDLLLR